MFVHMCIYVKKTQGKLDKTIRDFNFLPLAYLCIVFFSAQALWDLKQIDKKKKTVNHFKTSQDSWHQAFQDPVKNAPVGSGPEAVPHSIPSWDATSQLTPWRLQPVN